MAWSNCLQVARQLSGLGLVFSSSSKRLLHVTRCLREQPAVFKPPQGAKPKVKERPKYQPKQTRTTGPLIFVAIPIATFGLGCWQTQRLFWKRELIAELEEKIIKAEPVPLPLDPDVIAESEYLKVTVKGRFEHGREMLLVNRSLVVGGESAGGGGIISNGAAGASSATGMQVITPFILSDSGKRILVNRGWVPRSMINSANRMQGQIPYEVTITGVIRHKEKKTGYLPPNEPDIGRYFYRDIDGMAEYNRTLPIFVEADATTTIKGGPVGGQTQVNIRNEHFNYLLTWFSLSAITGYLWKNMGQLKR